nr:reverse transcriptase domain-containing protein [Tanacetum cinerariifolium]
MRTCSSSNLPVVSPPNPSTSNPKCRNHRHLKQPFNLEETPVDTMVDQRTMAELLRAPTEGYAEAIVVSPILAEQFELSLINMMTSDQLFGLEKDNPHDHIHWGSSSVDRKRTPVFYSHFGGSCFQIHQYKDLLYACPHHGFTELHQLDTFYNALNPADQDSLNSAAGGNLLERRTQDVLTIIENKSKMNTASTSRSRSLPRNTVVYPKGELKAITTRSGIVLDGPTVPTPPPFINPEVDERVEETLTDQDLSEYTINVPPPLVQKYKPSSQRDFFCIQGILFIRISLILQGCSSKNSKKKMKSKSTNFGLPELISTCMTLKLANRAISTLAGIARDVFVPVGKFTFPANFVIVDYESDPRVPLILERSFLRTARALIDVHERGNVLPEKLVDLDSTKDLHPALHVNPVSGSTTYSSFPNQLLEGLADELALITFPPKYDDDLQFDIESDLKEIEFLLHQDIDSSLKDSIDQSNLADNFVDSMPEMFTNEHALDYSFPPIFDEYDDDFFEVEFDTENVYDDPFDSKEEKIKESKLLMDELDLPCDFLLSSEYNSFPSEDFSRVDDLPSTNNEDKVFNLGTIIQENHFEIITHVVQDNKLATSNASLVLEDFDPHLYELHFFKEVPRSKMLLLFSSKNEEKVFKPGIHTSGKVHSSLITELSHQGYKVFKINQVFKSPMKIFLFSCGKDTHILAVPCLYFYPPGSVQVWGNWVKLSDLKQALRGRRPMLFLSF